MVYHQSDKDGCQKIEGNAPCHRYAERRIGQQLPGFQPSGKHDENTLPEDIGQPVKRVTDADKKRLLARSKPQHIKAVGSNIVRCRAECQQPEEGERQLRVIVGGDKESDACKPCPDEELHADDPPAFRLQQVDERTPKRFDHPGQIQPAGVERDLGI